MEFIKDWLHFVAFIDIAGLGKMGYGWKIDHTLWWKLSYVILIWPGARLWYHITGYLNYFHARGPALSTGLIVAIVSAFIVELNQSFQYRYDTGNFFGFDDMIVSTAAAILFYKIVDILGDL